jgi:D-sedoheptulose 7-phosphate isomerase
VEIAIKDGIDLHQKLLADFVPSVLRLADLVLETFEQGGKLYFLGNGGSAAEAQHIATEFVVRFRRQRRALPVIALTTDTSVMTAIGNDYDFDQLFARQVEALMGPGDLLVALSTSGSSPNVLEAVRMASQRGAKTVGFTGNRQGPLTAIVDVAFEAPSGDTQRIQEAHLLIWHIICDLVETAVVEQERTGGG